MDARPRDFELVRPNLLTYIGLSMPHMLPTLEATLDKTEEELALRQVASPFEVSIPTEMFANALKNVRNDLTTFTRLVDLLQSAPIKEQYKHHVTIIKSMEISLDKSVCPLTVTRHLAKIWRRLENLIPRKLYEQTLQLWLNTANAACKKFVQVNNSLLLRETPLIMFRVDERIFRSPPHFDLLIRMLQFYLDAVKNHTNVRMTRVNAASDNRQ